MLDAPHRADVATQPGLRRMPQRLEAGPPDNAAPMQAPLRSVLVIHQSASLRGDIARHLLETGQFDVFEAEEGRAGLRRAATEIHDLIVLHLDLPDIDGAEVCRLMRRAGVHCPVLILSEDTSDTTTIRALEAGANDFQGLPARLPVLIARIRCHLRQHEYSEVAVLRIGQHLFHPGDKAVIDPAGKRVRLTEKETAVLRRLHRADGEVVARGVLLAEIWGYDSHIKTHTLETHVYRLRQKLEICPTDPKLLLTEKRGYRLVLSG
ncbi:MAG: response regulator transcription factor [Pseudomonadota bacterium]